MKNLIVGTDFAAKNESGISQFRQFVVILQYETKHHRTNFTTSSR